MLIINQIIPIIYNTCKDTINNKKSFLFAERLANVATNVMDYGSALGANWYIIIIVV
jgi:hypothetical protein